MGDNSKHYILFRNGYSKNSPSIKCEVKITTDYGKLKWGTEINKMYYVLKILSVEEVIVMKRECESCIKRKTTYCPTSMECMATDDMPYYQNRIMLLEENKKLKEQLLVYQTNEETFRLEMEDITQTLGLDEDTIFDDVKAYVRSLKDNWNKLRKQEINRFNKTQDVQFLYVLQDMHELEKGSDSK